MIKGIKVSPDSVVYLAFQVGQAFQDIVGGLVLVALAVYQDLVVQV